MQQDQTPAPPDPPEPQVTADETFVILEGQVLDPIGAGQPGVTVTLRLSAGDGDEGELIGTAATDEIGDFRITGPRPFSGDMIVSFVKEGFATATRPIRVRQGRGPPFLSETLRGAVTVIGRIVEAVHESPVGGAAIKLSSAQVDRHTDSESDGTFTIRGAYPGRGELIVEADGYGRQHENIEKLEDVGEIVVRLKPQRIVHVRVVDESGGPIRGVTAEAYDRRHDDFRTGVTGADGLVTWRGIHFGADVLQLRLSHEDYVSDEEFDRQVVTPEKESESTHTLLMRRAGRVVGRVTDADTGKPVYGARVVTGSEYTDRSPRDFCDTDGRFSITGVPPGNTIVTVHADGHAPELKTVAVRAGERAHVEVALSPMKILIGVVRDEEGEPVGDAVVEATKWRGSSTLGLRAMTNGLGVFIMSNAPQDEFEISAVARGYSRATALVRADPDHPVELTLAGSGDAEPATRGAGVSVGDPVPDVALTTLSGRTYQLSELKGRTVLLDFWATWCAPCVAQLPEYKALYEKYGGRGDFVLLGINRDFDRKTFHDFLDRQDLPWEQVFDGLEGKEGGGAVAEAFGVEWIPKSFLIGPDGKVIARDLHGAELAKRLDQLLKAENRD